MKRTRKYTDEPLGRIQVIDNFLPPPDQLVLKDDDIKVTISLSQRSIEFFTAHAKKSNTSYERMIRKLLDEYVAHYSDKHARD